MVEKVEIPSEITGPEAPQDEQLIENSPQEGKISTTQTEGETQESTQQTEQTEEKPDQRPEWLPEKFNSPEDLAKAYQELEQKQSQQKQQDTEEAEQTTDEKALEIVKSAGLNMADLSNEYENQGQLTDESYEKLEKAGVPREYVDAYIAGREALIELSTQTAYAEVGGQENYQSMVSWAASHLSEQEINAYNTSVNAGNKEQAMLAVRGLYARYQDHAGQEPKLVSGTSQAPQGDAFRSTLELTRAMSDPRYKEDEAYRKEIQEKLARSNIL